MVDVTRMVQDFAAAVCITASGVMVYLFTVQSARLLQRMRERVAVLTRVRAGNHPGSSLQMGTIGAALVAIARVAPDWTRRALAASRVETVIAGANLGDPAGVAITSGVLVVALGLVVAIASHSGVLGATSVVVAVLTLWLVADGRARRRTERVRAQVPSLLLALASATSAGLSLAHAVARFHESSANPIEPLVGRLRAQLEIGVAPGRALEEFANSTGMPELLPLAVSIGIQQSAGGGAGPLIEQAADQIRRDAQMRAFASAKSAQGRLTLWTVTGIPLLVTALAAAITPGYLETFIGSGTGRLLLAVAVLLQVAGVASVRQVLSGQRGT